MKVKTSELTGAALDWAVAVALGWKLERLQDGQFIDNDGNRWLAGYRQYAPEVSFSPSTDWVQGGPLVERLEIYLSPPHVVFATRLVNGERVSADKVCGGWLAKVGGRIARKPSLIAALPGLGGNYSGEGPTPLIAICRAMVACKLGDEVEVPDELVQ